MSEHLDTPETSPPPTRPYEGLQQLMQEDETTAETQPLKIETLDQLKQILADHGLPIESWNGEGGTKTPEDLFKEVQDGESELHQEQNNEILRDTHLIGANIYYSDPDKNLRYRLREDRQVFKKDGSVKKRPFMPHAVAEKIKVGEDLREGVVRGLEEELGITDSTEIGEEELVIEINETKTYPGLRTRYNIHRVPVQINKEQYHDEGYVEEQKNKTIYFVWEKVGPEAE